MASNTGSLSSVGIWAMNIISSVGLIMANKQLMASSRYNFCFATTLTSLHFGVTALVGYISRALGYSNPRKQEVPLWDLIWFSLIANISIVGMNTSLMLNSVGFYQISKLSMIPVTCIMEWILHQKRFSNGVKAAVFVVVIGVGICTVTDVEVNLNGFICAAIAVFCSSLQQILVGSLQQKYSIGSFDLLSKTAPVQFLFLLVLGPPTDYFLTGKVLADYEYTVWAVLFIGLSCSLAVFCNLSQYLCIGRFSAVSFQVLGHMKTLCVLLLGWILFDYVLSLKNLMGIVMAVAGMIMYSSAIEKSKKGKPAPPPPPPPLELDESKGELLSYQKLSPFDNDFDLQPSKADLTV